MDSKLTFVPSAHIPMVWMKVLPYFLKGSDRWNTFYTIEQIQDNLIFGRQQLWVMIDGLKVIGCVMTQIDVFPQAKSLRVLFLGGVGFKRSMIKEMVKIEYWCRHEGITVIDFMGREEWLPLMKMLGYTSPARVYRKEL